GSRAGARRPHGLAGGRWRAHGLGRHGAQGANQFRLGDRLDDVLGTEEAHDFLLEVLTLAARTAEAPAVLQGQVQALL
ncbi:hypothetical protein ACYT6T_10815, partial [Streptococcus pyogenes]